MTSMQSSDVNRRYADAMPKPVIPTRHNNWFMRALWALALLTLVGIVYSFWRLSNVATPTLEVPTGNTLTPTPTTPTNR